MTKAKKYWKGLAELNNDPLVENLKQNEFSEEIPVDDFLGDEESLSKSSTSRRDFLKFLGFSTAAATLAACETPIVKSIPYVVKPEEIIPGVANWYASTFYDGYDFANVLVKTREGRPIFIKPNKLSSYYPNSRVISSVLSLYDSNRLKGPQKNGVDSSWNVVDKDIIDGLNASVGKIVYLTNTIISPTTKNIIQKFTSKYDAEHIQFDTISYNGMLNANQKSFGLRAIPTYRFDKSDVIVSFGADFLGSWLNLGAKEQYIKNRNPKSGKMSRHYQIESNLSLSGSNADVRIPVKPSQKLELIQNLYEALDGSGQINPLLKDVYNDLIQSKGKSLVVCDVNDTDVQIMINAINQKLSNYSKTIDISNPFYLKAGDDKAMANLIQEMNEGKISTLIISGVNPVYTLSNSEDFVKGLSKVDLKVSTSTYVDETAKLMDYICPDRHYLESWGDNMPKHNEVTFTQPTIQPLFDSRQVQDSLLVWNNDTEDYYTYLKSYWRTKLSWNKAIHDGTFNMKNSSPSVTSFKANVKSIVKEAKGLELSLYQSISIGDGQNSSNNPWLQELPDPVTRACWDNYLTVSAVTARELGLKNWNVSNGALNGDIVNVTIDGITLNNVPVLIQPGQARNSLGLALGYGRTSAGKVGSNLGVNAYVFAKDGKYSFDNVSIEKVEGEYEFASVQLSHTMMGRDLIKETTLADFIKDPKAGNHDETFATHKGDLPADQVTLWKEHDHETGHFWNLSIDLTSCIGCGSCVVACHSENNVPVVGKEEVRKSRDMHWLRIDRYYSSDMNEQVAEEQEIGTIAKYKAMEIPSENPAVAFQPVMCQHCNHAPCETVCPVAATSHSAEGLNHMAYNRCVGTRYCANNCPYKVRRFNWFNYAENDSFDYNMNDDLGKMVLNPDVTVRVRGVMEKCSMCVQMTQKFKLDAKREGRKVRDEETHTACSVVCPTNALVFGDVNDTESEIKKQKEEPTQYYLLEALNTAPSVFYHTKIRNTKA
ncbi:MAG: TAT-variant-translocated molybdopterin oxidoreductase [Flavobacteriales bacterium]